MKTVLLGDVAQIISGQSPSSKFYNQDGEGLPLHQGKKDFGAMFTADPNVWTAETTKIAEPNDILISVRAPVGPVNFANQKINIGRGLAAIRPLEGLDPKFLFRYLQYKEDEIAKLGGGTTFQSINRSHLKNLPIPYLAVEEQRRIVKKLDIYLAASDKAKQNIEKNLQNSQDLFRSLLLSLINQTAGESWELGKVIKLNYGKALPKEQRRVDGDYNVYGANGVKNKSNLFLYDKPSIIVGRKGSAGEVNLTNGPFWPLDVTYYVEHDSDQSDLKFIYLLLKTLSLPSLAKGVKPGINRNDVYSIKIKLPDLRTQEQIVKKLDELSGQTKKLEELNRKKLKALEELRQSILKQAFEGKL